MAAPVPRSEGRSGPVPRDWRQWPTALRMSVAFGIVGFVLLVVGFATGATAILVAATIAGSLSLISALVWRAQLIEAWRKEHGRPTRDW